MKRPVVVGLIGTIGSGKTTAGRIFETSGLHVISADAISHHLLQENKTLIAEVQNAFGADVVLDGIIQRDALAARVFSNQEALALLEAIEIPYIMQELQANIENSPANLVVVELSLPEAAPEFLSSVDELLYIEAEASTQEKRVQARDGSKARFNERFTRQSGTKALKNKATKVIHNNGSREAFEKEVADYALQLKARFHTC